MSVNETKASTIPKWVVATITLSFLFLYALPSCNEPPSEKASQPQAAAPVEKDWDVEADRILSTSYTDSEQAQTEISRCLTFLKNPEIRQQLKSKHSSITARIHDEKYLTRTDMSAKNQSFYLKSILSEIQDDDFLHRVIAKIKELEPIIEKETEAHVENYLADTRMAPKVKLFYLKKYLPELEEGNLRNCVITEIENLKPLVAKEEVILQADKKEREKRTKAKAAVKKKFEGYGTNSYRWDMQERMIKKDFTKTDEGLVTNKSGRQTYEEWEGTYSYQGYTFSVHCRWESMDAGYHYWTVTVN